MRLIDTPSCDEPLPDPETLAGAVLMGGPMSANDTDRHPWLAVELDWCSRGLRAGLPLLGVCLGAQLIARALGAEVRPAERKELGWGSLEVLDPSDPLVGALASGVPVLHWHGEIFDLPAGATPLARSPDTACQAFRTGERAWGLLFHAEADAALVDLWLAEPSMVAEAREALGPQAERLLREGAQDAADELLPRSQALFAAFAQHCAEVRGVG